jgi:ferric-dicitrate binding protein FerR (iron transport regulator)
MTTNDSNKQDPELSAALRALSEDDVKLTASPDVEKRLLTEVRAISRARRRRTWLGLSSVAAVLLLGIALYAWRIGDRQTSDTVLSPPAPEQEIAEVATEFLPLPYSHVPMNTGSTVRIEVPATALVSFGLAPTDFREGDGKVQADVLIGEDGLARAIRFVRPLRN